MFLQTEDSNVDLRIQRTRKALQQALIELMAYKSVSAITVQDIADKAMVNRATFYDHFTDKYALLEHATREWFLNTLRSKLPLELSNTPQDFPEHVQRLLLVLCQFLAQVLDHCKAADQQSWQLLETQVTALLKDVLLAWLPNVLPASTPRDIELRADIAAWATYGAALHWSRSRAGEKAEAFTQRALPMIVGSVGDFAG